MERPRRYGWPLGLALAAIMLLCAKVGADWHAHHLPDIVMGTTSEITATTMDAQAAFCGSAGCSELPADALAMNCAAGTALSYDADADTFVCVRMPRPLRTGDTLVVTDHGTLERVNK
jgi:hypothetical protein